MGSELSIIIVNYNGANFLEQCVNSYHKFLIAYSIEHEFLIIDNASTDESVDIINRLSNEVKEVIPFFSNINHGFSKANNILIEKAKYSTLALLNNDTLALDLNDICNMLDTATLNREIVYTCNILNEDLTPQKNIFNYPRIFNVLVDVFLIKKVLFNFYQLFFKRKSSPNAVYFSGCYLVINRDLYQSAGGFDNSFFFYHEECDLFLRLETLGIKKEILSDRIIHFGSGGTGISDFSFKNYYVNLAKLLIKHNYASASFIKTIFNFGFKFRIFLLKIRFKIHYSPFSHIYQNNKTSYVSIKHVIQLHRDTLSDINNINKFNDESFNCHHSS